MFKQIFFVIYVALSQLNKGRKPIQVKLFFLNM